MKKYLYMAIAVFGMTLVSCDDFLQREPLDFGDEDAYYNNATDLKIAANAFYQYLPQNNALWGGLYTRDVESDDQVSSGAQSLFYPGDKRTVLISSSTWYTCFQRLRGINFFINKTEGRIAANALSGNEEHINQYLGEGYFFRAYVNFELLKAYGDAPLLTELLPDDLSTLQEQSKRYPRNEVARAILKDLDTAIELMMDYPLESGRVAKDAARALKSRVALYEGTWEKYHANTCFVPGNDKWPGKKIWPSYQFPAGSAQAEYEFFFKQAYEAAEAAIPQHPLAADSIGYLDMFRSTAQFSNNHEVILARYYLDGIVTHSCSAYLKSGGGCNISRAAVNTYLMKNGLPIYASGSGYHGDKTSYHEFMDRDMRLGATARAAGFITGASKTDTVFYYKPYIYVSGNEKATTGYELKKWYSEDPVQKTQDKCTTAVPLFRSAELMLNYIEAYYELHNDLGGNCDTYWRALRKRAGVSEDYNLSIQNTDLSKENDLAVWSKSVEVDKTLYNIRRERRCELIAEGLRLNDLKRWRSLDKMIAYQPEGFNLWDQMYKMYDSKQVAEGYVSQKDRGVYMRPLQVSSTSVVYHGYNFPKQHYTEPIPISEFLLVGDILYQNPGWPSDQDGTAIYTYDCD